MFADFLGNHLSEMDLVFPVPNHTRLFVSLHAHVLVSPLGVSKSDLSDYLGGACVWRLNPVS